MSRSGYSEDCDDNWQLICWRGAVNSAIRGKRGQQLLNDLLAALDEMPDKRLYAGNFATADGEFCSLGVLGSKRGIKMDDLGDDEECDAGIVGQRFGIARALASEIMYMNDEYVDDWKFVDVEICGPMRRHYPDYGKHSKTVRVHDDRAAEKRWEYIRGWVAKQITVAS